MNEEITFSFKDQTGLRISKDNTSITTGKVVVNGIEITSVEDWEKVTKSINDLQKQNTELKEKNKRYKELGFEHLNNKNNRLEDNWNKLKEWLEDENNQQYSKYIYNYSINNWVLNKMQEIEGGMND